MDKRPDQEFTKVVGCARWEVLAGGLGLTSHWRVWGSRLGWQRFRSGAVLPEMALLRPLGCLEQRSWERRCFCWHYPRWRCLGACAGTTRMTPSGCWCLRWHVLGWRCPPESCRTPFKPCPFRYLQGGYPVHFTSDNATFIPPIVADRAPLSDTLQSGKRSVQRPQACVIRMRDFVLM